MLASFSSWSTLNRRQPGSSRSEPSASASMAWRNFSGMSGLIRTFPHIAIMVASVLGSGGLRGRGRHYHAGPRLAFPIPAVVACATQGARAHGPGLDQRAHVRRLRHGGGLAEPHHPREPGLRQAPRPLGGLGQVRRRLARPLPARDGGGAERPAAVGAPRPPPPREPGPPAARLRSGGPLSGRDRRSQPGLAPAPPVAGPRCPPYPPQTPLPPFPPLQRQHPACG